MTNETPALPPGRALDAEVARALGCHVETGQTIFSAISGSGVQEYFCQCADHAHAMDDYDPDDALDSPLVKPYSRDIRAAWTIIEHTTRKHDWRWQICVVRGLAQVWLVPVWHAATEADLRAQPDYMVDAETAPLAISRVAVRAAASLVHPRDAEARGGGG